MKKQTEFKEAAHVIINKPFEMTNKGRKQIAKWLRQTADFLESDGDNMSKRFTARYMYVNGE